MTALQRIRRTISEWFLVISEVIDDLPPTVGVAYKLGDLVEHMPNLCGYANAVCGEDMKKGDFIFINYNREK